MYRLRDFFHLVLGTDNADIPSDELACNETDTELTFYTNEMQETLAAYTYTLVERGWLNLIYNGRSLTLERGDLYIYSPGFQVTIVSGSEDYRGICLLADEGMTLQMPAIRDIIRTAYLPVAEWDNPWFTCPMTASTACAAACTRWATTCGLTTASATKPCARSTPCLSST